MTRFRNLLGVLVGGLALAGAIVVGGGQASAASVWSDAVIVQTSSVFIDSEPYPDPYYTSEGESVSAIGCGAKGECTLAGNWSVRAHDQLNGTWVAGTWMSLAQQTNGTLSPATPPASWNSGRNPGSRFEGLRGNDGIFLECGSATSCTAVWNEGYAPHISTMTDGQWNAPQPFVGLTCAANFEWPRGCSWGNTFSAPQGTPNMEPNVADIAGGGRVQAFDCISVGNCVAAGFFLILNTSFDAVYQGTFLAVQTNGVWANPVELTVPQGSGATVSSVSCGSAGNCVVTGRYDSTPEEPYDPAFRPFVVTTANGVPSVAATIPGISNLAVTTSIDCASAGNCTVAGFSSFAAGTTSIFTSTLANGTWSNATPISGASTTLDLSQVWQWYQVPNTLSTQLSCPSVDNCTISGTIRNASNVDKTYIASQSNGAWSTAAEVPGISSVGNGTASSLTSMDCPTVSDCVATGYVKTATAVNGGYFQPYVVVKSGGTWGNATTIQGLDSSVFSATEGAASFVSCASAGECTVAGNVQNRIDGRTLPRAFVATLSDPNPPTPPTEAPTTVPVTTTIPVTTTSAPVTTTAAPVTTLPSAPIAGPLSPGLGKARIGTRIIDVVTTTNSNGNTVLSVGGQTYTLPGTSLDTSKKVTVSGSGAKPGSTVAIQLFSTPQVLGYATVASDGTFSAEVSVPADTPSGDHNLQMVSTAADGTEVVVQIGVTVANTLQLPATGSEPWATLAGLVMTALGLTVVIARRRLVSAR